MYNKLFEKLFLLTISLTLLCTACVKKDPISKIAQVLFVPLSPNAGAVDFSLNGNIVATAVGYSTTTGTFRYTLPYFSFSPNGETVISYNVNGFSTSRASVSKIIEDETVYSTFLVDSANKLKAVIVADNLDEPTPGKVKLRFFNFSPNAPAIDVVIQGSTSKLYSNRTFNDQLTTSSFENFIEIDPGNYTFQFVNSANGMVLFTTTAQLLLVERIYTLAARGFIGGTGTQAIGAMVYPNKP